MTRVQKAQRIARLVVLIMAGSVISCGGGAGEFDKTRAAKAVMEGIKSDSAAFLKASGKAVEYKESEPAVTPAQYTVSCGNSKDGQAGLNKLVEKGLVKLDTDRQSGCAAIIFLDKATPYVQKQAKSALVMLAMVERVEVTDLGTGSPTRMVKYKAFYTPTPFGEALLKPGSLEEEKEAGFTLSLDEGWRMN